MSQGVSPVPGFDLGKVSGSAVTENIPDSAGMVPAKPIARAPVSPNASVADAFADLAVAPVSPASRLSGAVDITSIKPPRDKNEPAPVAKESAKPSHPSRFWVQVATGQNISALKFDWGRIKKKASEVLEKKDGYTAPWGQSNRLLTGPFDSLKAAQSVVTSLKKDGVEGFTFTSENGQEITPVK
ncbi:MAG: SPOR domain-containing protein [Sphingomonadaceae bacterium]